MRPANPPLLAALKADAAELSKVKGSERGGWVGILDVISLPGFWAVALWRVGNALHERGLRPLSRLTYFVNMVVFGADLPPGAVVGAGLVMPHPVGLGMPSDVVIGKRCRIMRSTAVGGSGKGSVDGHPVIGDDVWILDGAAVFGPVNIGDRVVIGARTVVSCDIPAGMLVLRSKAASELRIRPRSDIEDDVTGEEDGPPGSGRVRASAPDTGAPGTAEPPT